MPASILLIDDDPEFLKILALVLADHGFAVATTSSGRAGLALARKKSPSLIVLDLVMPGLRGIEVCQALKQDSKTAGIPVLILTANDKEGQEISCLDMGADDYLTKPANTERLLAHCRALLRRVPSPKAAEPKPIDLGGLRLDYAAKSVSVDGKESAHLTPREFELLYDLAQHSPQLRDKTTLYRELWGAEPPSEMSLRTVEVHVRRIRLKLGLKSDRWLVTVPGRGYGLVPPKKPQAPGNFFGA